MQSPLCDCEVRSKFDILKEADGKEQVQVFPPADPFSPQYLRSDKFRASYLYEALLDHLSAEYVCVCVCVCVCPHVNRATDKCVY